MVIQIYTSGTVAVECLIETYIKKTTICINVHVQLGSAIFMIHISIDLLLGHIYCKVRY